ncbi:MAG: helicase-related protein, partial [Desulfobulbus sp.]|nr:helicase-related protein [Desulfobulbus sp.]
MSIAPSFSLPDLPITSVLPQLKAALACSSAVLTAPPGSGKTTVVPLALLAEPWLKDKKILILEPRRLATRAAAMWMASLLGEPVGQKVGYQIRFDRRSSAQTRIEVVTEGILTRRLQQDAGLADVGLIIFDEFHERSLHADLALALCLDLCQIREDLRLLVMSATLDAKPIAQLLGEVPVITGEGQLYAVETSYLERPARGRLAEIVSGGVQRMLPHRGDILVFLPGSGEIRQTLQHLQQDPACADWLILPLLGELSSKDQDRAIFPDPQGRKRIILATAIAETSLTIEGIRSVVDSGWSRLPAFDPATGLSRLNTVRVSKATADQRTGRAGRLGPGHCLRLWTREEHHSLPPF